MRPRIVSARLLCSYFLTCLGTAMNALGSAAATAATLPIPCAPGSCAAPNPAFAANPAFVSSGKATAVQSGSTLTVNQTSNQAILNWSSFNISADGKVQFVQPSAASIALNRIYQQSPSSLFGQLTANGQIYLVNPNGILFGATAQVNVAGIIASSLQISDANFNAGLLSPQILQNEITNPNLAAALSSTDANGVPLYSAQPVTIQSGAQISAPSGRILLAAPSVQNAGTLSAPDGQVILAAGQQVFLQASSDPSLRGLIVEVDQGGTAWNQLTGQISADRGNISLIGLAVNQDGRVSATTSVSANGSVRLEAADQVQFTESPAGAVTIAATQGGTLELGPQSSIDLEPELSSSATAVFAQENTDEAHELLLPSTISMTGEQVLFEGGSVTAPNGQLTVVAAANPSLGIATDGNPLAQIRIHPGTVIDLSGSDVELPMSDNLLAIQLRANELADDPTQRNGALRGLTVYVDTRVGTSIVGASALEAAEQAVPYPVGYWTTNGGTASFQSEGDVVVSSGATINVSGGRINYDGGVIQTTQLIGANGQLYDIGTANPLLTYTGVVNPTFTETYNKWGVQTIVPTPGLSHYDSAYVEGASAGSLQFAAPNLVLNGTMIGEAVNGPYQRSASSVAAGGTLIIGLPGGTIPSIEAGSFPDFLSPTVDFVAQAVPVVVEDGSPLTGIPLYLPVDYLVNGGFTSTKIYGDTAVTLPANLPLSLLPGSSFSVEATRIDVESSITAPGGAITLQTVETSGPADPGITRSGIELGNDVTLDVRGQWTNDSPLVTSTVGAGPTLQNGGSITLQQGLPGGELVLGNDVSLEASGGAWISSSNAVTGGAGGSISILDAPLAVAFQIGSNVELDAFGVNGAAGGSFSLSAPRLLLAQGSSGSSWSAAQSLDDAQNPGEFLTLNASLFSNYGFDSVALAATGPVIDGASNSDVLTVQSGTAISAIAQTLMLDPGYLMRAGGGSIEAFSKPTTLPEVQRTPVAVSLSVTPQLLDRTLVPTGEFDAGLLDVETGASIATDPRGSLSLTGAGGIYVNGTLSARGGSISLDVPPSVNDAGYVPSLGIELGSQSVLDASGALVTTPNQLGLQLGTVLGGGSVGLLGTRGTVIADPGSTIDISGTSAPLDVETSMNSGVYDRETVASAGGSLTVESPQSVSLLGNIRAAAGTGNYGNPAGGSLEIDLNQFQSWFSLPPPSANPLPTGDTVIQLVSSTAGAAASAPDSALAQLGIAQLAAAGFSSLHLVAGSEIELSSGTPLTVAAQIEFDAPLIAVDAGVGASLAANLVQLGDSQPIAPPNPATSTLQTGTGTLRVQAQQIDLLGSTAIGGAQSVVLASTGDVQLLGVVVEGAQPAGSLITSGNLEIDAARIYPATGTSFAIAALGAGNAIRIGQTGAAPGTPLSAGGSVSLAADDIDSSGTLMAPFGSITLTAGTSLTLEPGSVTSVSASGATIPYGFTTFGAADWNYQPVGADELLITGIPSRQIQLLGPSVTVASGATINVSGGGDLYAYEWVPGTGGTQDALGLNSAGKPVNPGLYAVDPALGTTYAPYDPEESAQTGAPATGESIYLSGGGGLAAGTYALLPARDALLPGAFLVQVQSGFANIVPGEQAALADGTPVVAGYVSFGSTGFHSGGYQGVAVWPGSYAQQLATYTISDASTFFAAQASAAGLPPPALPADAGRLSIAVDSALNFSGTLLDAASTASALAGDVDVSASQLVVTGGGAATLPTGTVGITASEINGWQAGELVLGGSPSADGTSISVAANAVTLEAGAQIHAGEIVLVAGQSIDLQSGSAILSNSATMGGTAPAVAPAPTAVSLTSGGSPAPGAALLAVSDLALPIVTSAATGTSAANITLESGSTVGSLGAIAMSSPGQVTLAGTLQGNGASWSLASTSIGLLGQAGGSETLVLSAANLAALQQAHTLSLNGLSLIDIDSPLQLGSTSAAGTPVIASMTLSTPSLNYLPASGAAAFAAQTIILEGVPGVTPPAPATGGGSLGFTASEFDLASGTLAIGGVAQTQITASSGFVGEGTGGITTSGNLSITTPVITAGTAALSQISAPAGTLTLNGAGAVTPVLPVSGGLGGELDFAAKAITQSTSVIVPAGVVTMQAAQQVSLAAGAVIDTSGVDVSIVDQTVGAEGGRIALSAGTNLDLAPNSVLNVSGAGASPAGTLTLTAGGTADVAATLLGQPGTGAQGGSFSLSAGNLTQSLTALASSLQSGAFNEQVSVLVHQGNLVLAPRGQLTANQVTVTAEGGIVDVGGTISAPDADVRGEIGLYGGSGVLLESSGQLHADTAGGTGIGGTVELGTDAGGSVTLDAGSVITATGSSKDGTLLVRAPLVDGNTQIALTAAGSSLSGLGQILIEPVFTETATTSANGVMQAADISRIESDVTAKMGSSEANILAALNPGGSLPLEVRAAVDLVQNGNLTLTTTPNFAPGTGSWRFGGEPVDLTIRATGNLTIAGTLSDGFSNLTLTVGNNKKVTVPVLTSSPAGYQSASFRLVAGSDAESPDPLATAAGTADTLQLGSATTAGIVRTGTGEIDLVASGNIDFSAPGGPAGEAYTAGLPGASAVTTSRISNVFNFPTGGGNLVVAAGGNLVGALIPLGAAGTSAGPSVTTWQIREGSGTTPAQWGVDLAEYAAFGWNVGTLGGGDLRVSAGGDIDNLSAAAADSYVAASNAANGTATLFASGGLDVRAGGDIGSGQFFAADGSAIVNAGGGLTAVRTDSQGAAGSLIALQDSQVTVEARLGVDIDAIVNPTVMTQYATGGNFTGGFFSYGSDSSLTVQTSAGNVVLGANSTHLDTLLGTVVASGAGGGSGTPQYLPPSVSLVALSGDVDPAPATMYPSANGQLQLLAAQDINFPYSSYFIMSDAFASDINTVQSPGAGTTDIELPAYAFQSGAHVDDPNPALIVAGRDINDLELSVPKATQILAGQDITDLYFFGQNLNAGDVTLISAGRDFIDGAEGIGDSALIQIGGPGSVDVFAGRNVDLGFSQGLLTVGNFVNSNLAPGGASITVLAGLGQAPDYAGFLQDFTNPDTSNPAVFEAYVQALQQQAGVCGTAACPSLSFAQAQSWFATYLAQFQTTYAALSSVAQQALLRQTWFNQLLISGNLDNSTSGAGFALGYAAIDALFPNSRTAVANGPSPYSGDLTLNFSQIYTVDGGGISLIVPGGVLNVGLANAPASVQPKQPSQLGIVTEGAGDVNIYTQGDVNVNASRIFTLGGGNILIWSDEGNIDAGQGAKSSVSAPAPTVLVSDTGQVSLDFSGAVAGSGIRTIQVTASVPPGNVDLIAPEGTVNAGDAGIGASGNINIAAQHVLGLDNIQFGGTATGVPAQVSDIAVSLSGAANVASGATNSATSASDEQARQAAQANAAPLSQAAISWLDVFLVGLGEENCRTDDLECLKRQKKN